jgi:hypothetical protein
MKTLTELDAYNGLVYGRKGGMWVCGFNGVNLSLSTDKTLAVRYQNTVRTLEFAAEHGLTLIPARNRVICYA